MIGKLKGIIDSYGEDYIILDVGGVGYQVHCSARTLQALPSPGEAATLSIETYVREDQIKLFGFASDIEREWFRLLQTVQGVGAKVAMSVLGTLKAVRARVSCRHARQGHGGALARRRSKSGRAHRHRTEGQGAGLRQYRSGAWCISPARSTRTAHHSRWRTLFLRWSILVTVIRRPLPPSRPPRATRATEPIPQL